MTATSGPVGRVWRRMSLLAALAVLWSSTAAAAGPAEKVCGGEGARVDFLDGTTEGDRFKQVFVVMDKNKACPGLKASELAAGNKSYARLELRAVFYVPRPVGMLPGDVDLYSKRFSKLHERDLRLISTVLKANTIRIEPWDNKADHKEFLELCYKYNLFVIPTFGLRYFYKNRLMMEAPYLERETAMVKELDLFLYGINNNPVLGWTLDHALFLNETVPNGALSRKVANKGRDTYFSLVKAARTLHYLHMWNDMMKQFVRPLFLPLDMDSKMNPEDLFWHTSLTETVWSTWPKEGTWDDPDKVETLSKLGAFDAWLASTLPETNTDGISSTTAALKTLLLRDASKGKPVAGKEFVKCLDDMSTITPGSATCEYRTDKAIALEYGFSALEQKPDKLLALKMDIYEQQLHLSKVWKSIQQQDPGYKGLSGGMIDEWADDWNRCAFYGFDVKGYTQNKGGTCDEMRPGKLIHVEWLGLNGQYSFFGMHCIDPRFASGHPALLNQTKKAVFRFEEVKDEKPDFSGLCRFVQPNTLVWLWLAAAVAVILLVWLQNWCRHCRQVKKRRAELALLQAQDQAAQNQAAPREEKPAENAGAGGSGAPNTQPRATVVGVGPHTPEEPTVSQKIPSVFGQNQEFTIELRTTHGDQSQQYWSKERTVMHLKAHVTAQFRRLWHQVESEALACQAQGLGEGKTATCYRLAMVNIHARVLEGYATWLQAKRQRSADEDSWLAKLLTAPPSEEALEHAWELFVEAMLVRTIESLAEQGLHSPEFMSFMFHKIRWEGKGLSLENEPFFTIDYVQLRAGLEALKKNPNPYKGGINFDDINDHGRQGEECDQTMGKTYFESISLMVVVDLMTNFQPVIFVKMWIFMLAWYVQLGKDERNGTFISPEYRAAAAIQIFQVIDSCMAVAVETMVAYHDWTQRRRSCRGGWQLRRLANIIVGLAGIGAFYVFHELGELDWDKRLQERNGSKGNDNAKQVKAILVSLAVFLTRIVVFCISMTPRNAVPYIPGRVKGRNVEDAKDAAKPKPLSAATPLLLPRGRTPSVMEASGVNTEARGSFFQAGKRESTVKPSFEEGQGLTSSTVEENEEENRDMSTRNTKLINRVFWPVLLFSCFLLEVFMVVPLASGFAWDQFCGDQCSPRQGKIFGLVDTIGSDCASCSISVGLVFLLVFMTAFFDIYFLFYAGTAVVGYAMGEQRGLRNVLSTALRYLDLTLGDGNLDAAATKSWSQARLQITDGEALRDVFGNSWRMIWSRIVESLYDECQISNKGADEMVKAAGTVRWTKAAAQASEFAGPRDKFTRLRFVMLQTRAGGNAERSPKAINRCISQLQVRLTRAKDLTSLEIVSEPAKVAVTIANPSDREAIVQALTVNSSGDCVTTQRTAAGEPGLQLVSCNDFYNHSGVELYDFVKDQTLPLTLVFARPGIKYGEVECDMPQPSRIFGVSFQTGWEGEEEFDPVKWRIEGLSEHAGTSVWKQLIWQDTPYVPPTERRKVCATFGVELWRIPVPKGQSVRNVVDFKTLAPVVQERLGFFTASLRGILQERTKYRIRKGVDTLLDSHLGNIPSLSQIIPVYAETVILSDQVLKDDDKVNSNLAFIISQYPEEWAHFSAKEKMTAGELYQRFMQGPIDNDLKMKVRLWASMRSQTVARTIVGALYYHDVIAMLPTVQDHEDARAKSQASSSSQADVTLDTVESVVELMLAHQTFGSGPAQNDEDVKYMLRVYHKYPFYLVFDYDSTKSRMVKQVNSFLSRVYNFNKGTVQFASVLARHRRKPAEPDDDPDIEIVAVLPRYYPLLLGEHEFRTQGKSGNQLGALRFARGHYLQMMDCNMGAFFGEACKVPFAVRRFQPWGTDRTVVEARIIGFREFIFTEQHGLVGNIMASAEWSFGTICQRFLSGLGARMHYGHPDFLDAFWASNRGSLSKASPAINLSEDIFAGFNVAMRDEKSKHVDFLAWEKGREASFNAATLFYRKISQGNAGVMRSRDLKIITESLGIFRNFSFYFASVGFYLNNLLIDFSLSIYVRIFIFLTLASKSLHDVGALDSMLAAEWIGSLGIIAMVPRFMELTLEYGPLEGILRFLPSMPCAMAMFTFINKAVSAGLSETMQTGEATYIATGRPNANTHYSWRECYFVHCETHYYPALEIFVCYCLYQLVASAQSSASLPMIVVLISTAMWIVAPILFCPQPTLGTLGADLSEFWQFAIATPERSVRSLLQERIPRTTESSLHASLGDARSTVYEFWLSRELMHKKARKRQRFTQLLIDIVRLVLLVCVVYSAMLDHFWTVFLLFVLHFMLMELWRFFDRPTVMQLLSTVMWAVLPAITSVPMLNLLIIILVVLSGLRVLRHATLLAAWIYLRPNIHWSEMPERTLQEQEAKREAAHKNIVYDGVVEYMYVNLLSHQLHLYCAFAILVANLATQSVLVVLEHVYGLHSWFLLNPRLRSAGCCARRTGYVPS